METINRYVVKTSETGFLLAFSQQDFSVGDRVCVQHKTRFDGLQNTVGTITVKRKQELSCGKIPAVICNGKELTPELEIGTLSMQLMN